MGTPKHEELKFVLLHNFSKREISLIMSKIKALYPSVTERKKLVFTKTTEHSKKMKVQDLIEDASGDHIHLLENPPENFPENNKK